MVSTTKSKKKTSEQAERPLPKPNEPAAHAEHVDEPSEEYEPGRHNNGDEELAALQFHRAVPFKLDLVEKYGWLF